MRTNLVHRLAYNGDVAAGQLAVFQGASEAPMSGFIRIERATRKNSQLAAARRVAMKMGRQPRCSSVTYQFRYAPSSRLLLTGIRFEAILFFLSLSSKSLSIFGDIRLYGNISVYATTAAKSWDTAQAQRCLQASLGRE